MVDKEILTSIYNDLKNNNKKYFRTGFNDLDSVLKLSKNGEFVLIGARPCMGKTAFIISIVLNIVSNKEKILFYSSDYSIESAIKRLILSKSEMNYEKYYNKSFTDKDFKVLAQLIEDIKDWNIKFDDNAGITFGEIEKYVSEQRPKVVFIDDIDRMKLISKENGSKDNNNLFKALRKLAQNNKCIIFVTTTLTREPDEREFHYPVLSDLKEFRSVKYVDTVLLLYRDSYYEFCSDKKLDKSSEIIVAKNKNYSGCICFNYSKECARFYEKIKPVLDWFISKLVQLV